MAISLVQTKSGTGSLGVSSMTLVWDGNTVSGNCIIIAVESNSASSNEITSITDSQSNTYTSVFSEIGQGIDDLELWYAKNITGGTTPTITITATGGTTQLGGIAREYSGLDTTAPLDKNAHTSNAGSSALDSGATTTTAQADELLIGVGTSGTVATTFTAGTNYGNLVRASSTLVDLAMEDRIVAATGTYNATMTASGSVTWQCGIATFKAAAAIISAKANPRPKQAIMRASTF